MVVILNALDEVLYWDDISFLKNFICEIFSKYYPHDSKSYFEEKDYFYLRTIPDKKDFLRRMEYYVDNGKTKWISGRNELSDDISYEDLKRALLINCKSENGCRKAFQAERIISNDLEFWDTYANHILYAQQNTVLELTIGGGLGTTSVMRKMRDSDLYIGVDIDFNCAKNADAIARHFGVNGLGIATSLWNMPFDDQMFTTVCSNAGLEECREIPAIIKEAARVLVPGGRMVLHCINFEKSAFVPIFSKYGFSDEEIHYWLRKLRLYSDVEQVEDLASKCGLKMIDKKIDDAKGYILVLKK